MSKALTGLHNQTYDPTETLVSQGLDGSITAIPDKNNVDGGEPTETVVQVENHSSEHASLSHGSDNQERREVVMAIDVPEKGASRDVNPAAAGIEMPEKGANDDVSHASAVGDEMPLTGDDCNISADVRVESSSMDKNDETRTTHQNDDGPCFSPSQELPIEPADGFREISDGRFHLTDNSLIEKEASSAEMRDCAIETIEVNRETLILDEGIEREEFIFDETKGNISVDVVPPSFTQECHNDFKEIANDEISDPLLDNCSVEAGADVPMNSLTTDSNMNLPVPDVAVENEGLIDVATVTDDRVTTGISMSGTLVEDECAAEEVTIYEGDLFSTVICTDELQSDSCPLQLNPEMENGPSNGEVPGCQEGSRESAMGTEMPDTIISAEGDSAVSLASVLF